MTQEPIDLRVCRCPECEDLREPVKRTTGGPKVKTEGRVLWRGHWYCFDKYLQYYTTRQRVDGVRKHFILHREIYKTHVGPIADGLVIHHKDHDKTNNQPWNLEPLSRSDHAKEEGHGAEALRAHVAKRSPEERSRLTRENVWAKRKPKDFTCTVCGDVFQSIGMRAKFCPPCRGGKTRRMGSAQGTM